MMDLYLKMPLFELNHLLVLAILASKRYENLLSNAGKGFFRCSMTKTLPGLVRADQFW